jgi:hypothetical protein
VVSSGEGKNLSKSWASVCTISETDRNPEFREVEKRDETDEKGSEELASKSLEIVSGDDAILVEDGGRETRREKRKVGRPEREMREHWIKVILSNRCDAHLSDQILVEHS